jgi:transketolase
MPGMTVIRPSDDRETVFAWYQALKNDGPTSLILTRQNLKQIDTSGEGLLKGAYVLLEEKTDLELILIATGSEVGIAYEAAEELQEKGIGVRVVSIPSWELFETQSDSYKEKILPSNVKNRISVEASSSFGWQKFTGLDGINISIDTFGISAPYAKAFEEFGFSKENIINQSLKLLDKK